MPKACIIVSHTHWDREWYEPYQRFRLRLVRLMDKLLHILDNDPAYCHFMLDGQTIILEDYLQIRPEKEGALRRYVQEGRLLIGPWHVLPDEFLVSGEAIVRNLLLGERIARRFGGRMSVGYTPDPFGHVSQLPQILRGFGIDCAVLRRGLDDQATELFWQAPDGSTVLLCYLRDGYDNAAHLPMHDEQAFAKEIVRLHSSLAPHATTEYVLLMNGTDHMEPSAELPQALAAARRQLPDIDLLHGTLPMYIDAVKQRLQLDLDQAPETGPRKLQTIQGELRSSKRHHLLPGVLSTRMWIKQRNNRIQNLLEKWAEPFAALAAIARDKGQALSSPDSPYALIWQAWKYLLQNHPHDSICGCSADQTHREMATRFDWAEQIAAELAQQSLASLANQIDTRQQGPQQSATRIPIVVFNPLAVTRTDLVTASVQVPGSMEEFTVLDAKGRETPHQVLTRKGAEFAALHLDRDQVLGLTAMVDSIAAMGLAVHEVRVSTEAECAHVDVTLIEHSHTDPALVANAQRQMETLLEKGTVQNLHVRVHLATTVRFNFVAEGVPGCGYKTFFLGEGQEQACDTPASASLHMENESLAVDINPDDGTLTLTDKCTATTFSGLHRFVDGGDRGDEYNHCPPEADVVISVPVLPPEITWLEQGPVRWTIQVRQSYHLPASLTEARSERSQQTVEVPITSRISLCRGVPRLDFRTEIDNLARDHRLRVHFPTLINTDYSKSESTFDVVQRPLGVPESTANWIEQPVPTHPQKTFVDVSDGKIGLMLVNRGLPEYEVSKSVVRGEVLHEDDGSVTIALTLLRCVGWLSRDDYPCRRGHAGPALETPEAQCMGPHVFEYSLVPHAGTWQGVYHEAHAFNAPLWAVSSGQHDGTMPLEQSLVKLRGKGLVLSAIKAAEASDGLIVRFYNIAAEPAVARLQTHVPAKSAALVNLAEQELQELEVDDSGLVTVETKGKQIVTVKLMF